MKKGSTKPSILIIDDDRDLADSILAVLEDNGYEGEARYDGQEGLDRSGEKRFNLVLTDFRIPGLGGMEIIETLQSEQPRIPVVMITGFGNVDTAIGATKRGAFDYLVKPFSMDDLLRVVSRAVEAGDFGFDAIENAEPENGKAARSLVGKSRAIQNVYKDIGRIAPTKVSVLICGETGVGKELVAQAIHEHSERASGPFIAVNCGAIPDKLLGSELFGYEKGAFTGADSQHKGYFEQAQAGTLFLDEVGDLPLNMQVKLLRVLQEKRIHRLGGEGEVPIDVRILAATNQKMEELVREQQFREDLFYRLNTVIIDVPPLRNRRDDIPLLIDCFTHRAEVEQDITGGSFSKEAVAVLTTHDWPGNVRQLGSFVSRALFENRGFVVSETYCTEALDKVQTQGSDHSSFRSALLEEARTRIAATSGSAAGNVYNEFMQATEAVVINEALSQCEGNRTKAAGILGISRVTLRQKITRLGIS